MSSDKIDNYTTPFAALEARVNEARHKAGAEARRESRKVGNRFIRSRGTWLCTSDASGQCSPAPEAEGPVWGGTKREIDALIADCLTKYPHVTEVYIAGGFDSAERLSDFSDFNYEPWVGEWSVSVWLRGQPPGTYDTKGLYGIRAVSLPAPGALTCGTCGRSWTDDITPAGRCPWEYEHKEEA
jgi:hypothetical protein